MAKKRGRGRPRKSVEEHIRDGTYRRGRHGPKPGEVEMPKLADFQPAVDPLDEIIARLQKKKK